MGIRIPWTLANEEVWQRTHRMASRIWVIGGLICLAISPVNTAWAEVVYLAVVTIMAVVPIVYSYLIFPKATAH